MGVVWVYRADRSALDLNEIGSCHESTVHSWTNHFSLILSFVIGEMMKLNLKLRVLLTLNMVRLNDYMTLLSFCFASSWGPLALSIQLSE